MERSSWLSILKELIKALEHVHCCDVLHNDFTMNNMVLENKRRKVESRSSNVQPTSSSLPSYNVQLNLSSPLLRTSNLLHQASLLQKSNLLCQASLLQKSNLLSQALLLQTYFDKPTFFKRPTYFGRPQNSLHLQSTNLHHQDTLQPSYNLQATNLRQPAPLH